MTRPIVYSTLGFESGFIAPENMPPAQGGIVIAIAPNMNRDASALLYGAISLLTEALSYQKGQSEELVKTATEFFSGLDYMTAFNLCSLLSDCLQNSPELRAIVSEIVRETSPETSSEGGAILPPAITQMNLLPETFSCDDEHAFGMAQSIVEYLALELEAIFAEIEIMTNQVEILATLADNNAVTSIVASALEFSLWLKDTAIDIFNASNTPSARASLACDLYCIIKRDCTLSLDSLIQWVSDGASAPFTMSNVFQLIEYIVDLGTTIPAKVGLSSMFWLVLQLEKLQALSPIQVGLLGLQNIILLSQDETDNGYLLCNDCPASQLPYCYVVSNFLSFGASVNSSRGVLTSEGVLGSAGTGSSAIRADFNLNNTPSGTIGAISLRYTASNLSPTDSSCRVYVDEVQYGLVSLPASGVDIDITFMFASSVASGNVRVYFDTGRSNAALTVHSVSVSGDATDNPYPAMGC